ncbi:MAG: type I secretion C-terminal target domain-containing protein [Crocosphaera sp.]
MSDFRGLEHLKDRFIFDVEKTYNDKINDYSYLESPVTLPYRGAVKIVEGKGEGQIRRLRGMDLAISKGARLGGKWEIPPDTTSKFVVFRDSSGQGEVTFRGGSDLNDVPGNDFMMTLGTFSVDDENGRFLGYSGFTSNSVLYQFQTLAHEIGHNFGLRHGGTDHESKLADTYRSIMSYVHQINGDTDVDSFSGDTDNTFDDWANIELDFFNSPIHLGNSFVLGLGGAGASHVDHLPEPGAQDFERFNNPRPEENKPTIIIESLSSDTTLPVGSDLTITLTVTDDSGVERVDVLFDVNGDGDTDDTGEILQASMIAPDTFEVTFTDVAGVAGADGVRSVLMVAKDIHENVELETLDITPTGTNQQDNLLGTSNDDVFIGMSGADNLTGNGGSDTFVYNSFRDGIDTITDFGVDDFIDLSAIFSGPNYGSSTPFEDYVELVQVGADTQVRVNPVGDMLSGVFSNLITLENVTANDLNASNILV